jgi:hypothetical protein
MGYEICVASLGLGALDATLNKTAVTIRPEASNP